MSILHYFPREFANSNIDEADDRIKRNPLDDLKLGLDLIFGLKDKIDKLHPLATEGLLRIITY